LEEKRVIGNVELKLGAYSTSVPLRPVSETDRDSLNTADRAVGLPGSAHAEAALPRRSDRVVGGNGRVLQEEVIERSGGGLFDGGLASGRHELRSVGLESIDSRSGQGQEDDESLAHIYIEWLHVTTK